uniref:Uncharacterized protein n=1 Tax=Nelumbo nucifera TaxID=4432 RepID=A0A822Y2I7_NELNU|nr:TPA_asm: hypothetical protein HUJ06_027641 [Nelumbo nucifera]
MMKEVKKVSPQGSTGLSPSTDDVSPLFLWNPPKPSLVKVNTDGIFVRIRLGGYGFVIRSNNDSFLVGKMGPFKVSSPLYVE